MSDLAVPAHVPSELVFDFDIWNLPAEFDNPQDHCLTLREAGAPRIFYTPRNGGHWMLHHFDDTIEGFRDTDFFTNFPNGIPAREGAPDILIPVEVDPPEHKKYRNVLGPAFSPVVSKQMEPLIRTRVIELIDAVAAEGRCNFAADISGRLPTSIFIGLAGMPMSDFDKIMEMEHRHLRGETAEIRAQGANEIFAYLQNYIQTQASADDETLSGRLLRAIDDENEPWTMDEVMNCATLLYIAGLDTVTNMMSFIWHRLTNNPSEQKYIAEHMDEIPKLVDELMRLSVPAFNARRVRQDGEWRGIFMKAGDAVLNAPFNANRDPEQFPDPDKAQWDRANARQHIGFGAGPHRCLGQHLAKQEIIIALEEWFKRIPSFAPDPDKPAKPVVGNIMGFTDLPLTWSVK